MKRSPAVEDMRKFNSSSRNSITPVDYDVIQTPLDKLEAGQVLPISIFKHTSNNNIAPSKPAETRNSRCIIL